MNGMKFNDNRFVLREPVSPTRLKIVVGGDFCPGDAGAALVRDGRASEVFAPLAPSLDDADWRLVQFETPIPVAAAPIPKTGPNLIAAPETTDILRGRFDVALLANNHVGDHGPQGVLDTVRELRDRGFRTVGAGANLAEAEAPLELERGGVRADLFNFAEFEFGIAGATTPGVAPQRPLQALRAVERSAAASHLPVVVLHGGHEFNPFPSPRLRDLCRAFAEAGARFVVNCHPHCPEGVEWHAGAPIVYSPGNLWFPPRPGVPAANRSALWSYGYLAKALFDDQGPFALEIVPYTCDAEAVRPLDGAARDDFLRYIGRLSAPIADDARLQAYFDAWCAESGRNYLLAGARGLTQDFLNARNPAVWSREFDDPRPFLEMRNVFTCESHHDIVRGFLRQVVEGRLVASSHLKPAISALQNPDFALPPGLPSIGARAETLDFFERNVFGRVPEAARHPALSFEETAPGTPAMDGRAVRRQIRVRFAGPGGEGHFDLLVFIPATAKPESPVPAALLLCNRDPSENMDPERVRRTPFWDAERIVSRGWAALAFHVGSVVPDDADGFECHLQSLFLAPGESKAPDAWATLAAWAWCGSRTMDWIETEPRIDARRVMVAGHSRGGKTALWCAAEDERFAMAVSSCSGCGGAKLNRVKLPVSEHIDQITRVFPHWFCGNYLAFAGHDFDLPFDQHQLIGLLAPRLAYVSSASLDPWAGPYGEFLAARAASPAWRAFGRAGIAEGTPFPEPDSPVFGDGVGYHLRAGVHTIEASDWDHWIDFAERNWRR